MASERIPHERTSTSHKGGRRRVQPSGPDLSQFLGDPLPSAEAEMWAAMSTEQRAKALQRMTALTRWMEGKAPREAEIAAANAGLSLSRFYEMSKEWRQTRSLKSLGTFAASPRKRESRHAALLRSIVGRVIDAHPEASVRQLALALGQASGLAGEDLPSHNTLRRFVDDELRRRGKEQQPGNDLMFDCCACSMRRMDGSQYTLFAIIDKGTQLLLGASLGEAEDSRSGYAKAARDALIRLASKEFAILNWVERPSRFELVVGLDAAGWSSIKEEVRGAGIEAPIELSTNERRFGRYLKGAAGERIGRISLYPTRTGVARPEGVRAVSADDLERLQVEVEAFNADRLRDLPDGGGAKPPAAIVKLLRLLAGQ